LVNRNYGGKFRDLFYFFIFRKRFRVVIWKEEKSGIKRKIATYSTSRMYSIFCAWLTLSEVACDLWFCEGGERPSLYVSQRVLIVLISFILLWCLLFLLFKKNPPIGYQQSASGPWTARMGWVWKKCGNWLKSKFLIQIKLSLLSRCARSLNIP
jgi:hypothetical protein